MKNSEYVEKYDPQNQFDVLVESFKQIEYSKKLNVDLSLIDSKKIKSIIVTGLGGSAISGDLIANILKDELKVPFSVNRNYNLPSYADENTLLICSSYSGNTEETLSATEDGIKKGCKIICITTGGKLGEVAQKHQFPVFRLKEGFQPRYALWLNIFALLKCLHLLNLVLEESDIAAAAIDLIKKRGVEFSKDDNRAIKIAESLVGFIPLVYAVSDITSAVGIRMKCQFNENSKVHSFCSMLPELNHNEIIGWETFHEKQFAAKVISIYDDNYHPQVKKRIDITNKLIEKAGSEVITIKSDETNFKLRIFDLVYLVDWISYYLAILKGQDPSLIENILYLKEKLVE